MRMHTQQSSLFGVTSDCPHVLAYSFGIPHIQSWHYEHCTRSPGQA